MRDTVLYPGEEARLGWAILSNGGFPSLLFALVGLAFRSSALLSAHRLVLNDQTHYDRVWAEILADPARRADLAALQLDVRALADKFGPSVPRQLNRARKNPSNCQHNFSDISCLLERDVYLDDCGMEGTLDPSSPVVSLDQLYCQAIAAKPILIHKVAKWAAASDGCF